MTIVFHARVEGGGGYYDARKGLLYFLVDLRVSASCRDARARRKKAKKNVEYLLVSNSLVFLICEKVHKKKQKKN